MSQKYICIEGNIGSGKTTFTKQYAKITGATAIYEQFSDNPFLELFYKNPKQHAFPLEMSFLSERFQQLNNIFSKPDLFTEHYVSDYTFLKTLIFAKNNLTPEEYELFKNFFNILNQKLPKPDLIVFLSTELDYLKENIQTRGRGYEKLIETKYLELLNSRYQEMLLTRLDLPIVLIEYNYSRWNDIELLAQKLQNHLYLNNLKKGLQII